MCCPDCVLTLPHRAAQACSSVWTGMRFTCAFAMTQSVPQPRAATRSLSVKDPGTLSEGTDRLFPLSRNYHLRLRRVVEGPAWKLTDLRLARLCRMHPASSGGRRLLAVRSSSQQLQRCFD